MMRCLNCLGFGKETDTDRKLYEAVQNGRLVQVEEHVEKRKKTYAGFATALPKYDISKKNAIHLAVEKDRLDILDAILSSGFVRARDLISKDKDNRTPLHYAMIHSNLPIATYLIETYIEKVFDPATGRDNIDFFSKDNLGWNQLHLAAYYHVPIFHLCERIIYGSEQTEAERRQRLAAAKVFQDYSVEMDVINKIAHYLATLSPSPSPSPSPQVVHAVSNCKEAFNETALNDQYILHIVAEKCSGWTDDIQTRQLDALKVCCTYPTVQISHTDSFGHTPIDYATSNNYSMFLEVFRNP